MTQRIFVDRSRYESAQRCQRARWYGYHQNGMGITSQRQPLPLAVGSSVHVGLARLLKEGQRSISRPDSVTWVEIEEYGVEVALRDFAQYQNAIDAPDAEQAAMTMLPVTAGDGSVVEAVKAKLNEFDEYLFHEQSSLVEALVRAYARRRLRPLLDQFEVLEVEREGEWTLSKWDYQVTDNPDEPDPVREYKEREIVFMSRPDALLRDRESNQLYLLSYKTTGSWDIRKARDAEHDMQGMSEGIEIERRLGEWWQQIHEAEAAAHRGEPHPNVTYHNEPQTIDTGDEVIQYNAVTVFSFKDCSLAMMAYLRKLDAPPRILAVRMEFLLKGERWKDKELSARFGVEMRSQKSHLIRAYEATSVPMRGAAGYNIGDLCWSWEYVREDGRESTLAWQNWKSHAVWELPSEDAMTVKRWIDALDDAAETMSGEDSTMGMPPRLLGYKCDAQAVGLTAQHPLDAVFIPPITVYRNDDDVRDMVDQMEAQERKIAEGVAAVNAAADEGERRHALNIHFPQTRRACEYPTTCSFSRVCYGSEDIRRDPLSSGLYKIRKANHPQELEGK